MMKQSASGSRGQRGRQAVEQAADFAVRNTASQSQAVTCTSKPGWAELHRFGPEQGLASMAASELLAEARRASSRTSARAGACLKYVIAQIASCPAAPQCL